MLQRLLVALFAATFALGAFAQGAPKSDTTKAPTSAEKKHAKGEKKHKGEKKAHAKAKADETKTK